MAPTIKLTMDHEVFESLCTKFLFTNYNHGAGPDSGELNTLLNDLNDACHDKNTVILPQVSTYLKVSEKLIFI